MLPNIKTISIVTVMAALIWIWAEGESVSSVVVNPRLTFAADPSGAAQTELSFLSDENWRGTVRLRLEGSTVAIKQAERALGSAIQLRSGQPGVPSTPGPRQTLNLVEALRSLPEVKTLGVTIVDVDPSDIAISVTRYVTKEIAVKPDFPKEIVVAGESTLTPGRVTVRLPEGLAATLTDADTATVRFTAEDLKSTPEDVSTTVLSPVLLPATLTKDREHVQVSPKEVSVTFRLKRNIDTVTLSSVPVWIAVPPTEGAGWDVELKEPFLRDVRFTGPAEAIKRLRERTFAPIAEVRLKSEDLESNAAQKEAVIALLPPGVDYTVTNAVINLVIRKRETGGIESSPVRGPSTTVPGGVE